MANPVRLTCPGCGVSVRVALGAAARTVRCPKCRENIPVPAVGQQSPAADAETQDAAKTAALPGEQTPKNPTDASPELDSADNQPRRQPPAERSKAWRLARIGLLLIMIASVGQVVLGLLTWLIFLLSNSIPVQMITSSLGAGLNLTGVVGIALLTFVPTGYAPRKLLLACLAVTSLSVIHGILIQIQLIQDLGQYKTMSSDAVIKKTQDDIKKKAEEDARKFVKMKPEEMQKEFARIAEDSRRQVDEMLAAQNRRQLWNLPLVVLGSVAGILLPLYFRQLAESLKLRETVAQSESLIKWRVVQVAANLVPQLLTTPQLIVRHLGPLLILFRIVGVGGMLLGLYCLVLEIQIVMSLRSALAGKTVVTRKRTTKSRKHG